MDGVLSGSRALFTLQDDLQKEECHTDRDAAVRDVKNRERADLEEIRHEAILETIDDVRECSADDESEPDGAQFCL